MATTIRVHVHHVRDKLIAVSDGGDGQMVPIPSGKEQEILNLMAERHRIGVELTAQLISLGMNLTEDDETVVWNSRG